MRLFLLASLTMIAFAGNSILTRMGVQYGGIDPSGFAIIRVISGAVILGMVMTVQKRSIPVLRRSRIVGAGSLAVYLIGFSLAYLTLDAGLGALILFGVVQITMFLMGALKGQPPSKRKLLGSIIAFGGLILVLWPAGQTRVDLIGAVLMIIAGVGWGLYTLAGKAEPDALAGTAANFLLAVPILLLLLPTSSVNADMLGIGLAILSGAITSGLGYTLWYAILPRFEASVAAIIQLSVPIIAILGGAVLLAEPITLRLCIASALVLGGIAWAVTEQSVPADRS